MSKRTFRWLAVAAVGLVGIQSTLLAQEVTRQALRSQVDRLEQAFESLGQPFSKETTLQLETAKRADNAVIALQQVLDPPPIRGAQQ